jgi:hypothetical protein
LEDYKRKIMKKFIVYTRPVQGYPKTDDLLSIVEVEGEVVAIQDDCTILWLPKNEYKFRILKPDFLREPREIIKSDKTKEKVMSPPIYYSHSVFDTKEAARLKAIMFITHDVEMIVRKTATPFDAKSLQEKLDAVQEILL